MGKARTLGGSSYRAAGMRRTPAGRPIGGRVGTAVALRECVGCRTSGVREGGGVADDVDHAGGLPLAPAAGRPDWAPEGVDLSTPSVARAYDYALGGAHSFAIDREFFRAIEA